MNPLRHLTDADLKAVLAEPLLRLFAPRHTEEPLATIEVSVGQVAIHLAAKLPDDHKRTVLIRWWLEQRDLMCAAVEQAIPPDPTRAAPPSLNEAVDGEPAWPWNEPA